MKPSHKVRLRSTGLLLAGGLGRGGAQGIAAFVVAAGMGAREFGVVATVQVTAFFTVQLTTAGAYVAQLGVTHEARDRRTALAPSLVEIVLLAFVSAALSYAMAAVFLDLGAVELRLCGALALVMSLGSSLEQITQAQLISTELYGRIAVVNASRALFLVVGSVAYVGLARDIDASGWLAVLIVVWIGHVVLLQIARRRLQLARIPAARWRGLGANIGLLVGFGFSVVATAALRTSDQLIVAAYAGLEEAGEYAIGARLVDFAVLMLAAYAQSGHRALSQSIAQPEFSKMVLRLARQLVVLAVPLCLGVAAAAVVVEMLLGDSFAGVPVLGTVLALSLLARGAFLALAIGLMLAGRTLERTALVVFALLLNIGLNFALVPALGSLGAAFATVLAESALAAGLFVLVRRLARVERPRVL